MTFPEVKFFAKVYHHKFIVMKYLSEVIKDLVTRSEQHDASKFEEDEFPFYVQADEAFQEHPYGSPENEAVRAKHKALFETHHRKNRHHPEHFPNGVDDMTLVDLIEMLADWKAASLRNPEGDIAKSIQLCKDKYNLSPQLVKILENTAKACNM